VRIFITSATYFPWFHWGSSENEQSTFWSDHIEQTLDCSKWPWLTFQRRYDASFGRLALLIPSVIIVLSMNRDLFSFFTSFLCFRILSTVPIHGLYTHQSPSWADNVRSMCQLYGNRSFSTQCDVDCSIVFDMKSELLTTPFSVELLNSSCVLVLSF